MNKYSEGMDNGQKTPRGHPDYNSYVNILRVFIDNGRTIKRQTNGRMEKLIRCGLGNLIGSSRLSTVKAGVKKQLMCANVRV